MNKICTSIEQSKKLVEILPHESADMYWDYDVQKHEYCPMVMDDQFDDTCIRAWSLSALLDVLPNNEHIETTISRGSWKIDPVEYLPNTWWCEYEDTKNQTEFNISADNIVDACYKMILKLHEINLL